MAPAFHQRHGLSLGKSSVVFSSKRNFCGHPGLFIQHSRTKGNRNLASPQIRAMTWEKLHASHCHCQGSSITKNLGLSGALGSREVDEKVLWKSRDVPQGVQLSDAAASAPTFPTRLLLPLPPQILTSLGDGRCGRGTWAQEEGCGVAGSYPCNTHSPSSSSVA